MIDAGPAWTTSAHGREAHTRPAELRELGEHLGHCQADTGRMFFLQCAGEVLYRFLAPRMISVLLALLLLTGIAAQVW